MRGTTMYCTNCLKPCDNITAEFGVTDHGQDRGEIHCMRTIVAEVSDCCEAEIGPGTPHEPFCCSCDEAGPIRCPHCGEWYCAKCFGADRADAGGPCPDCTVKLARGGIY